MNKRLPLFVIGLVLVSAGIWAAMRPSTPKTHPDTARYVDHQSGLNLVAGFSSYSGLEAGASRLHSQQHAVKRQRLARPADPRYPPHVLDTLIVDVYPLLGTQGQLRLEYFNDRLYEVDFKPEDAAAAFQAIKRTDPELRRDRNGRAERLAGSLRVATNVEMSSNSVGESLGTEPYVLWQDLRLVRERDDWDTHFGALPYSTKN